MSFTYKYWRLLIYNNDAPSPASTIAEWDFFDAGGSPISTSGGTPSASSTAGGTSAANAFDGNASTIWASSNDPAYASPDWLQYQFASAVTVGSYSISCRNDFLFGQSPSAWTLQGSSNGSTWTNIGNYCATAWTSAGQTQTFNVGNFGIGSIAYRLLITADAASQATSVSEWKLYDLSSTQISTPVGASGASSIGGASFASSAQSTSASAFDANTSTFWASSNVPSGGSPEWLAYQFSSTPATVGSFSITARNDGFHTQTPSAFSLQRSTDGGSTWTTLQTYTPSAWTSGQTQTFSVPSTGTLLISPGMDGGMRPQLKGGMNG